MIEPGHVTHVAFSDESHWNVGRYRGLGLVTLQFADVGRVKQALQTLLRESNVAEFKWRRLDGAKERFAAIKMCKFASDEVCNGCLRIDVATWDIEDTRHRVKGRDDIANLQRMYYHLFRNVLRQRWPDGAIWGLYPDEHTALNWASVKGFLDLADSKVELRRNMFSHQEFSFQIKQEFKLKELKPSNSRAEPLIQLADLFVGLCIFSRLHFAEYESWHKRNRGQLTMLEDETELAKVSGADKERCAVLAEFNKLCKERRLGVSLETTRGLRTLDPGNPINFWWYEPQHPLDKAPTAMDTNCINL